MKKAILVSVFTLLVTFSFNAYCAEGGWYLGGNIGMVFLDDSDLGIFDEADLEDIIGDDVPAGSTASLGLEYDMGFLISVAPGYDFGGLRLESELGYQINDLDTLNAMVTIPGVGSEAEGMSVDGDATTLSLLFNGYYDFFRDSALRPFITGGIGLSNIEADIEGGSEDDTVFGFQIGAGLSFDISENATIDLKYRYLTTSDLEFEGIDIENSSHSVILGVRFSF